MQTRDDGAAFFEEIDGLAYDASEAPDAEAWLGLDEDERLLLVQAHHRRIREEMPTEGQRNLHAVAHVAVETQLASDDPPEARRTLERLLRAGVGRHSAIHAIGNEFMALLSDTMAAHEAPKEDVYEKALRSIDPEAWLHDTAGHGDD